MTETATSNVLWRDMVEPIHRVDAMSTENERSNERSDGSALLGIFNGIDQEVKLKNGVSVTDLLNARDVSGRRSRFLATLSMSNGGYGPGDWNHFVSTFHRKLVWVSSSVAFLVKMHLHNPSLQSVDNSIRSWGFCAHYPQRFIGIPIWVHCFGPSAEEVEPLFLALFSHMTTHTACSPVDLPTELSLESDSPADKPGRDLLPLPLLASGAVSDFVATNSCLRKVSFSRLLLNADMCRVLGTASRLNEVTLLHCGLDSADSDATAAWEALLRSNQGPTHLEESRIDNRTLGRALQRNTRVRSLTRSMEFRCGVGFDDFARGLALNRGLKRLVFEYITIDTPNLIILCQSLGQHRVLKHLGLQHTAPGGISAAEQTQRMHAIAAMVRQNRRLVSFSHVDRDREPDNAVYRLQVVPALNANLNRPRVRAIARMHSQSLRPALLGRALYKVQDDPNVAWMFLRGNTDVLFLRGSTDVLLVGHNGVANGGAPSMCVALMTFLMAASGITPARR